VADEHAVLNRHAAAEMNVWLSILQRSPITTPRWISTYGPICVSSPIVQP
jgi:hypothetical protein